MLGGILERRSPWQRSPWQRRLSHVQHRCGSYPRWRLLRSCLSGMLDLVVHRGVDHVQPRDAVQFTMNVRHGPVVSTIAVLSVNIRVAIGHSYVGHRRQHCVLKNTFPHGTGSPYSGGWFTLQFGTIGLLVDSVGTNVSFFFHFSDRTNARNVHPRSVRVQHRWGRGWRRRGNHTRGWGTSDCFGLWSWLILERRHRCRFG